MKKDYYEPNPFDTTTNAHILVPPLVWMELKCKRPDPKAIVRGREELVLHRPRVPYKVDYEPTQLVFTPLSVPDPPWIIVSGFTQGTYVVECFDAPEGGNSYFMWDCGGQENFRAGEPIQPGVCKVMR